MIKLWKRVWAFGVTVLILLLMCAIAVAIFVPPPPPPEPWESNPDDYYVERIDTVGFERVWVITWDSIRQPWVTKTRGHITMASHSPDSTYAWQPITAPVYKKRVCGLWTEDEVRELRELLDPMDTAKIHSIGSGDK